MVTTHSEDEWRLLAASETRAAPTPAAGSSMLGSASTTASTTSGAAIGHRPAREARGDPRAPRGGRRALLGSSRRRSTGLELPCDDDADHERSWFVYVVTLPADADREAVIAQLEAHGVQTARYLPCIHLQPYMRERFGFGAACALSRRR